MTYDSVIERFEFPTLTKVHGELDFQKLKQIKNEIKANVSLIQSTLGGGAHGHLGLVLTPVEYALVSGTPYVRPVFPGILIVPANTTQHAANAMRDDHKELIRQFREVEDLEKATIQQLSQAIPAVYLKQFRNRQSNAIDKTIPHILSTLFSIYGVVSDDVLQEEEEKIKQKTFDITQPLCILIDDIEDLQEMALAANSAFSDSQLVRMGMTCIKNTNDFEQALSHWYAKPVADRTWQNFKTHFEEAQLNMRKVRGPTMRSNLLNQQVNHIMDTMEVQKQQYLNAVTASEERILKAFTISMTSDSDSTAATSALTEPTLNSVSSDKVMLEMVKLLKEIKDDMKEVKSNNKRKRNSQNNNNNNNNNNRFKRDKYCWSHGACNHDSKSCRRRLEGHQEEATFNNRMGGSNRFCKKCDDNDNS